MASSGRAIAGVVVLVAAALVLLTVVRGHGEGHPAAAATGGTPLPAGVAATPPVGTASGDTAPGEAAGQGLGASADPASAHPSSSRPAARTGSAAPVPHADPLAAAAASYAASRAGTVLAAVYDLRTGQSWRLGDGRPQAEASVVKLDILQALLARHGGAGLSPDDQTLAQAMIEDSDNDSATSLWDAVGGAPGLGGYNGRAGLTGTTPSACVTCAASPGPAGA